MADDLCLDKFKFPRENIMVLSDDAEDERNLPTRENIMRAMQWLAYDAHEHDSLFFHCTSFSLLLAVSRSLLDIDSGHGGQIRDTNGDEVDGMDESASFPSAAS